MKQRAGGDKVLSLQVLIGGDKPGYHCPLSSPMLMKTGGEVEEDGGYSRQ